MLAAYKELLNDKEFMSCFITEYEKKKAKERQKRLYYLKQKFAGIVLLIVAILFPVLLDGDATASVLLLPLGIYLLFTREKVMDFKGKDTES